VACLSGEQGSVGSSLPQVKDLYICTVDDTRLGES